MRPKTINKINVVNPPKPTKELSHIAFVANSSASIYQFRRGIIKALMKAGFKVTCIVPEDSFTNRLIHEKYSIKLIEMHGYTRNLFKENLYYRQLKSYYKSLQPDLIIHYTIKPNIWGTLAADSLGIRNIAVLTGLGYFPDILNSTLRKAVAYLYRKALQKSNEVWFLNKEDQNYFRSRNWLKNVKSKVLPSEGVDTSHFAYEPMPPSGGTIKVLYAGRLIRQKGVYEYAAAAKTLQVQNAKIECSILGFLERKNPDAVALSDLETWRKEGFIDYLGETHDVRPYLAKCDILVLPSSYREGVSRILLEAMSIGRPIITTDNVGCGLLVEHLKNGFLIPQKSPAALVEALQFFASLSYEERVKMGRKGRTIVQSNYEETIVIEEYFKYIRSIA